MVSEAQNSHYARLRRQFREQNNRFNINKSDSLNGKEIWLYGLHAVEMALKNPKREILQLLLTQNAQNKLEQKIDLSQIPHEVVSVNDIKRYVEENAVHQGILLKTLPLQPVTIEECHKHDLVILLDQITDPHNVGAIMRSGVALKAGAIITTSRHSPNESAVLAKAASGALELIDSVHVRNLAQAISELQDSGFSVIGLDSEGEKPIEETLSGNKIAIVLGAEGKGLRQKTREVVNHLARLEMYGEIKSLNVSNAAAISLYCARQYLNLR